MSAPVPGVDPDTYTPSRLHDAERNWPETNCYVDLLIEVLHAAGYEPTAAFGFTVAQDFEGDHFTFFKFPTADLQTLYGIDIEELAVFDRLDRQALTQINRGRLPMVEVDAFYLPDTKGLSYRIAHSKTSIGINELDPDARRMVYFHGPGLFALEGEDYDGIFPAESGPGMLPLFPYSEFMKFDRSAAAADPVAAAYSLLVHHLQRRPRRNPIATYRQVFAEHARELAEREPDYFHVYAFNTLRQVGANFELLASHLEWLGENGVGGEGAFSPAVEAAQTIARSAKTMQFKLARAMARKRFDGLAEMLDPMVEAYATTMDVLDTHMSQGRVSGAA